MMHRATRDEAHSLLAQLRHQAHAWFVEPQSVRHPGTLERLQGTLSTTELSQYRRFAFPEHAHLHLVAHGLLRQVLSCYTDVAPADWMFKRTAHGRPEIANPAAPPLRFNLTHTAGLAACVVTLVDDCGIDAEQITSRHNPSGVAERMFSETEARALERLQGKAYLEHFFNRWTLREAYVKARGIGISFPTQKLTFTINRDNSAEVSFHASIDDRRDNWHFQLFKPTGEHVTAIALRRSAAVTKTIVTRFADL